MPLLIDESFQPRSVNQQAVQRFLKFCETRTYTKKSLIIKPNDYADTLYYILDGSVSVLAPDEDGNEIILAYLNKGEFIGEIGMFYDSNTRLVTVRARTPCVLAEIKYSELDILFEKDLKQDKADLLFALGLQLAQRLLKTSRRVTHLATMDVAGRIARTLLDMCNEPDAMSHPDGTMIHVSRQDLARIVGCSREVAGRVLKKMSEEGMIDMQGMNITVFHSR